MGSRRRLVDLRAKQRCDAEQEAGGEAVDRAEDPCAMSEAAEEGDMDWVRPWQ